MIHTTSLNVLRNGLFQSVVMRVSGADDHKHIVKLSYTNYIGYNLKSYLIMVVLRIDVVINNQRPSYLQLSKRKSLADEAC